MVLTQLSPAQLELVELGASFAQRLGLPRSTGQVYGLLFTSPRPLSLDDIAETLALSKTSASTAARQLAAFSLIRQAWLPGERRDHYEARTDLREVARTNYQSLVKPRWEQLERRLEAVKGQLEADRAAGRIEDEAHATSAARLDGLGEMHRKLKSVLPLLERLL